MEKQQGVTVVDVFMLMVVLAIVAVVAIPQFSPKESSLQQISESNGLSSDKVKSAFALAIAKKGDFPTLSEIVEYIDADFASETNDLSGVMFRSQGKRNTVTTYSDSQCSVLTNTARLGTTDIVRCVGG